MNETAKRIELRSRSTIMKGEGVGMDPDCKLVVDQSKKPLGWALRNITPGEVCIIGVDVEANRNIEDVLAMVQATGNLR